MINFCTLYSGSSGNSVFITDQKTRILIDAGRSGRDIETSLQNIGQDPKDINAILVTHEHTDHIRGVGILSRKYNVPIYANKGTWDAMSNLIGTINSDNIKVFNTNEKFNIGDVEINPFDIPHDAAEPVGYNFYINNKKVTTATDIGHINDNLREHLKKSDILLIESNHDVEMVKVCRYPYFLKQRILGDNGHLSNETTGKLLCELINYGTNKVLLGHLSRENNFPELCYKAVTNILESNNIKVGKDIKLEVALRDKMSTMYAI
jgi:phosphoribosyl 1,2-cyclic phosphodiesterase